MSARPIVSRVTTVGQAALAVFVEIAAEIGASRVCQDRFSAPANGSCASRVSLATSVLAQYRVVKKNHWLETELLAGLRARVKEVLK